jgi:hypothetical protein
LLIWVVLAFFVLVFYGVPFMILLFGVGCTAFLFYSILFVYKLLDVTGY